MPIRNISLGFVWHKGGVLHVSYRPRGDWVDPLLPPNPTLKRERWRCPRRQTWRRIGSGGGVVGREAHDSQVARTKQCDFLASGEDNFFSLGSAWIKRVFLQLCVIQMQFHASTCVKPRRGLASVGGRDPLLIPVDPRFPKRSLRGSWPSKKIIY